MARKKLPPIHPGEILLEEFLRPLNITKYRLAKDIHVSPQKVGDVVNGKRSISVDTALRLARYFNTTKEFWLGLQTQYDLEIADDNKLTSHIEKEVHPYNKAA